MGYANTDYTALRVYSGFSNTLTVPSQVAKMTVTCTFRSQSTILGTIQADPQDSQKLDADFKYQDGSRYFNLSTKTGNIKSIDISLGQQEINRNGLGSGPSPWIMIWGDHGQSLSLEMFFWFGNFTMTETQKSITMTSNTAPFSYIDRPIYNDEPGVCTWVIELK